MFSAGFRQLISSTVTAIVRPEVVPFAWNRMMPFSTSQAAFALPSKKKRKMDPQIERNREERRKKRIVKALKKMEKKDRILKPLVELEIPPQLMRERSLRERKQEPISEETEDYRARLLKDWNRFCGKRHKREILKIDTILSHQQKALGELRKESHDLYMAAIKFDESLYPYQANGPTRTPPIPDYIQDGEYVDTTKKFQVQYPDMKLFMMQLLKRNKRKKKKSDAEEEL